MPARVGVEPLVGRRDRPHPEPGPLEHAPGVDPGDPVARQVQGSSVLDERLGEHEHGPRRGGHEVGQRPGVQVVGVLVAGQDDVDVREVAAP